MGRSLAIVFALACAAPVLLLPARVPAAAVISTRSLPMHFELRQQGPAAACGSKCARWIAANGAITADTPRDFENFARGLDLSSATVVLNSDGGSVHGAIAFGRVIRRLKLDTTVGRIVDLAGAEQDSPRASFSPQADCESMCAFVLLGGVARSVPAEARVMVHQIWLGDRRDDPTAATYSAEDLVLVQRDIGRLAKYTIDMGGSIELLDLALRIPPWEPMHVLTPEETRQTRVATEAPAVAAAGATVAAAATPPAVRLPLPQTISGVTGATKISERQWAVVDRAGGAGLARRHPLTVEGAEIGTFDLILGCGVKGGSYDVSYLERRHGGGGIALPAGLGAVSVRVGDVSVPLKVVSSERRRDPDELVTYATGLAPAALIDAFAAVGNHSIVIETHSARFATGIRLGNTGVQQNWPRLAAGCGKAIGNRADLIVEKTGGSAAAK
jgi:hypothetical protein